MSNTFYKIQNGNKLSKSDAETKAKGKKLTQGSRLVLSLVIGCVAAWLCALYLSVIGRYAHDFAYPWRAAQLLRAGINPYEGPLFNPMPPEWGEALLFYPMPAVVFALPFSFLPYPVAGVLWTGLGAGLLSYAVLDEKHRYLWPMLLSIPFIQTATGGNWGAWLISAALIPMLSPLLSVKPTIGASLWMYRPHRRAVVGGMLMVLVSFVLVPDWVTGWLSNLQKSHHPIPIATFPYGPLLLLAVLQWRDPKARLLLGIACVPQVLVFYDQLALFLCARTQRQALILALTSWAGGVWWHLVGRPLNAPSIILPLLYLPALAFVLWPMLQDRVARINSVTPATKS